MISQTVEYALRAVVDLAYHFGSIRTTTQIAEATKVPAGYLAKILKDLSRRGLVRAQRGLGGGYTLDRDPKLMTVYDVMSAVDPPKRILKCPLDLPAHRHQLCPLHRKLDDAMAAAEQAFRSTTIADVTADPTRPASGEATNLTISGGLAPQPQRRRSSARTRTKRSP